MFLEFLLIFIISLCFIAILKKYAYSWGFVDIPNERSIHVKHTARGAGIGFYLAVAIVFPFFHLEMILSYLWSFIAIFFVFAIGVLDDHHDSSHYAKFFVMIFSTILLSFDNILINSLGTFFGVELSLGWLALPFTIFAVVGFTNALNLIDGLDGLSASLTIVILGAFFWLGYMNDDMFITSISAAFIVTLLAFLIYNWHPASIFMGDSGSLTLGFVIALLGVKSLAYIPAVSILFITAIPLLDTFVVMIRRKRSGKSFFEADQCHIHHVLQTFFSKNTKMTVLFLLLLQSIYSINGIQFTKENDMGMVFILFILNVIVVYILINNMITRQKREC